MFSNSRKTAWSQGVDATLEVYSQEFQNPRSLAAVDSDAGLLSSQELADDQKTVQRAVRPDTNNRDSRSW